MFGVVSAWSKSISLLKRVRDMFHVLHQLNPEKSEESVIFISKNDVVFIKGSKRWQKICYAARLEHLNGDSSMASLFLPYSLLILWSLESWS